MTTTGGTSGVVQPLSPLTPVVNLGNQYIDGMNLAWVSTTSFTVSVGACRDASGLTDILMGTSEYSYANQSNEFVTPLPVAVTVSSAVVGAGGLDTGTLAASTSYYVYAIGDSKGFLPASAVFSASAPTAGVNTGGATPTSITLPTGPTLPTGIASNGTVHQYDCFRYLGSVVTDGSKHFVQFTQARNGASRAVYFDPPIAPGSAATAGSTTFTSIGTLTGILPAKPVTVLVNASIIASGAGGAVGDKLILAPFGATSSAIYAQMSATSTSTIAYATLSVPDALNAGVPEVDYRTTSAAGDVVSFTIAGYIDNL